MMDCVFKLTFVLAASALSIHAVPTSNDAAFRLPMHLSRPYEPTWGQYSPYHAVEAYRSAPDHCEVAQVNILQRHGARYPTSGATTAIKSALRKIQGAREYNDPRLAFLTDFVYELGTDDLIPFGAKQSFEAGKLHFERYANLISQDNLPFVRASSSDRVVDSAMNWTAGFAHASGQVFQPQLSVILSESLNDTLADNMCPNVGNSDQETNQWQSVYASPIAARLNLAAPGANLTIQDIPSLLSLCPFETLAYDRLSPFCNLFTPEEFHGYEYFADLGKYYGTGYGQALGPVQGVGYVNELLARLTGQPVRDHTQTNSTLDSSPITFPLNRTVYADFSHDNQMVAIYAAMGLFSQPRPLDPLKPNPMRTWVTWKMVSFSARMITEKLLCSSVARMNSGGEEYVRVFVNDALQPLEFCGADHDGLCRLDAFVNSQNYSRSDGAGDFEKCFD